MKINLKFKKKKIGIKINFKLSIILNYGFYYIKLENANIVLFNNYKKNNDNENFELTIKNELNNNNLNLR